MGQLNLCVETMNPWRGRSELNRHTTRMKIRGSVVSSRFIFSHLPEDEKKKNKIEGTNLTVLEEMHQFIMYVL